jgi:hypothetical protein
MEREDKSTAVSPKQEFSHLIMAICARPYSGTILKMFKVSTKVLNSIACKMAQQ